MTHHIDLLNEICAQRNIEPRVNGDWSQYYLWAGLDNPIIIEYQHNQPAEPFRAAIIIAKIHQDDYKLVQFCGLLADFNRDNFNNHHLNAFYDKTQQAIILQYIQPADNLLTSHNIHDNLHGMVTASQELIAQWRGG